MALAEGKTFTRTTISRASIAWRFHWQDEKAPPIRNPTAEMLRNLVDGDIMVVTPPVSKADKFGTSWGNSPIFLRYSRTAKVNAARELAEIELALPCSGEDRAITPLFTAHLNSRHLSICVLHCLLCLFEHLLFEIKLFLLLGA